jgi:hypothetical protein
VLLDRYAERLSPAFAAQLHTARNSRFLAES